MITRSAPLARCLHAAHFGLTLLDELKRPYELDEARTLMGRRIEARVEQFIVLCRSAIYSVQHSPYRWLLERAGYSAASLEALVRARGLEAALTQLAADGVYLDVHEFKGRRPVVRRGETLHLRPSDLSAAGEDSVAIRSSGSSGPPTQSWIGIAGLRLQACFLPLVGEALAARDLPVILYYPMATASGIYQPIIFALAGMPVTAWFSQVRVSRWWYSLAGLLLALLHAAARLKGVSLPAPRFADVGRPLPLARWIHARCPRGALIGTFPGSALRLLQAARAERLALPPLTFILGGEPITERKRAIIEEAGHRVFPWYGSVETGRIAVGCLRPAAADDMHVLTDRLAAIARPRIIDATGVERPALLVTSSLAGAHVLLLNVETGDEGVLATRACGCPWETLGLTLHVQAVRSFEKLTVEGMTFVAQALARLVDEILPARCGGIPTDYQFAEEEGPDGLTRLVLSVSPEVRANEGLVRHLVLQSLSGIPRATPMAELMARADAVVVRRAYAHAGDSGKILILRRRHRGVRS